MFKKGDWIVVSDVKHKYFGYEGEITDYEYGSYYAARRWEVVLEIDNNKELRIYISEKDMMVIDRDIDKTLKRESIYHMLKHQIDEALDNRDEAKFMELTGRLKVFE